MSKKILLNADGKVLTSNDKVLKAPEGVNYLQQLINSRGTNGAYYLFYGYTGDNLDFVKDLDFSECTSAYCMFTNSKNVTSIPEFKMPKLSNSPVSMFSGCTSLIEAPLVTQNPIKFSSNMFKDCTSLVKVPAYNLSQCSDGDLNMFSGCTSLKTILTYGMKLAEVIKDSTKYDVEDLVTFISNCQVVSNRKITMGSTNLAKLENVYVKETGIELYEGITCRPCVICEPTDEGAMLVIAYANNKGWTLA